MVEAINLKELNGDELVEEWFLAKEEEDLAKNLKQTIESEITTRIPGDEESTVTKKRNDYKLTVTRRLTRSIEKNYEKFMDKFDDDVNPIIMKPSIDLVKLRAIETANPKLAKITKKFITVKPAKPSVKIEKIKKEEV